MAFTPISDTDFNGKGARSLSNQPTEAPEELKRKFDEPAREVVAPKVNRLITELEDTTAAASIGATAPTGRTVANPTVQSDINKLSTDLATVEGQISTVVAEAHTHDNKALLDTYTQTEADLASAVADDHTHSNKALLDTYTQSESDIADAVGKKHDHSNKALLDTYSQSESDLADAVSKKHDHSNKSLLDSYTQTETDLADAVSKKHAHSNKAVLDKFGESGGNPTYDGNPIGGGGSASDTFKNIVSGGTTFVASGNNDTFKINAGSNVTITALSSPDKGISISATGGGQSTGDMLMSDYDPNGTVKSSTNGITGYVASEIGKLDVSDSAVSGKYVSAVSETDGKITVSRENLPTVPTKVSDLTNDSGYQTAGDVATAISGKADTSSLGDLAYIDKDGVSSTKVLQGDGTWINPPAGYDMINNANAISLLTSKATDSTDDDVASGYAIANWSNTDTITLLTQVNQGDDAMGTWEDDATWESGSRAYWLKHTALHGILSDDDVEISLVFDVADGEAISCLAYRIDDAISSSLGGIAIKFNAPVQNANGATVGVVLKRNRTNTETVPRTS